MANKPINEAFMSRFSFVIADYWRKLSRKPNVFSIEIEFDTSDSVGLMNTIIDDNDIDGTA
jgi:hypothetical protein